MKFKKKVGEYFKVASSSKECNSDFALMGYNFLLLIISSVLSLPQEMYKWEGTSLRC